MTTDPTRYSRPAIWLHWLMAASIIAVFGLGLYMVQLPFSPQKLKLINWHKWAGIVILLLAALRLLVRLLRRPPALPPAMLRHMPGWQQFAHHAVHHSLYVLFFAVPLLGWAYSSAAGFPIVLFGQLPLPDWIAADPQLAQRIKPWHQWSAFALIGLASLHILAALKHQFIDRDGLLRRMWPGKASS
ncbi:cytochrome b [Comamonadaceae bacterium OH2310_COT-174]|nr:cytochrome b [Comamonadaceae bacterium OH2310_COT-174]